MKHYTTEIIGNDEFDSAFIEKIESICRSIELAGFDPYSQLIGYLLTSDERYITRTGNARDIIHTLDQIKLLTYVNKYLKNK